MQFGFATAADIRFGRGVAAGAAEAALARSPRVLLIHGKDPHRAAWLVEALQVKGAALRILTCPREPDVAMVEQAVALAHDLSPGVIVALGGGSAIDLAKATAALARASGKVLSYLEGVGGGQALDTDPIPVIALPTTAGTGAEVTRNAVISVPENRRKVSLRDPRMIPALALVDPALTDNAPPAVTLASGFDAVTQVIEPFLSTKASPLTDALCRDAIPRGLRALHRLSMGEDQQARDDIALTSLFGGMALANAGLGAVHGLAGVLGGRLAAPHGALCAALLPHVLRYNAAAMVEAGLSLEKMDAVSQWIVETLNVSPDAAPEGLAAWMADLGLPDLTTMGMTPDAVDAVAVASAAASSSQSNPVLLTPPKFADILRDALGS